MTVFRLSRNSELPIDIRLSNLKAVEANRPQIAGAEADLVVKTETVTQFSYYNAPSVEVLEREPNSPIPLHEPEAYGSRKSELRLIHTNGKKLDVQIENIVEIKNPTWNDNQHFAAAAGKPVDRNSNSNVPLQ